MIKLCPVCSIEQPLTNFSFKNKAKQTYQSRCKSCHSKYLKAHYEANKDRYIFNVTRRKNEVKDLIRKSKSVPCMDCKITYPYYVMDFDHRSEKSFELASSYQDHSMQQVKSEIAKCDVVCSNCHRERTQRRLLREPDVQAGLLNQHS